MRNRILDFSDAPARLRVEREQLIIHLEAAEGRSIPLDDLAVVILAHPQLSCTQAVLAELASRGAALVACNDKRLPVGLLLPLDAHSTQTERFRRQLELPRPRSKQLWRRIIQAKIRMQASLLEQVHHADSGLRALVPLVRSGDPANIEARAARKYWTALFGGDFRRDVDAPGANALLNYGYAVLRAACARALCGAGLHPSLGLHHHNRYNAFCLADDMLEPFRPVVDQAVIRLGGDSWTALVLARETRAALLQALTGRIDVAGESLTLFDALAGAASSLAQVIVGEAEHLRLPDRVPDAER